MNGLWLKFTESMDLICGDVPQMRAVTTSTLWLKTWRRLPTTSTIFPIIFEAED